MAMLRRMGSTVWISDSNSETVYQRGTTHCDPTGQVESREDDYYDSEVDRQALIRSTNDFGDGDSGGPLYEIDTFNGINYIFMVNISTQYPTSDCEEGYGSAFYVINDEYGVKYR